MDTDEHGFLQHLPLTHLVKMRPGAQRPLIGVHPWLNCFFPGQALGEVELAATGATAFFGGARFAGL
jgi:hypothetical protein